jgi:PHS family inorganic phosphate transporter-like MFS transporter
MQIYSLFMFLGIFTTLLIPETRRISLEVLSGEERTGIHNGEESSTAAHSNNDEKVNGA